MKHLHIKKLNISLYKKLFLISFGIFVCFFIPISLLLSKHYIEFKKSYTQYTLSTQAIITNNCLNDYINEKNSFLDKYCSDQNITNFIVDTNLCDQSSIKYHDLYGKVNETLNNAILNNEFISDIWIANDKTNIITDTNGSHYSENIKQSNWYKLISTVKSADYIWVSADNIDNSKNCTSMTLVKPIQTNGNIIGYIGMNTDFSEFLNMLDQTKKMTGSFILTNDNDNVVYQNFTKSQNPLEDNRFYDIFNALQSNKNSFNEVVNVGDFNESAIFSTKNFYSQWNITILNDTIPKVYDNALFSNIIILLLFVAYFAINIIIFSKIVLKKYNPVPTAIKSINDLSEKYDILDKSNGIDIDHFDDGIKNISHLIEEKDNQINAYKYTDEITSLPNCTMLRKNIETYIKECNSNSSKFAVVIIDIFNLSLINNLLGHNFGDQLLNKFAQKLNVTVSPYGKLARFYGDKFALIMKITDDKSKIEAVTDKIHEAFADPIVILEEEFYIKTCVGISIFPDNASTVDELLKFSDSALFAAKQSELEKVQYYTESIQSNNSQKAIISQKLTNALSRNEFYLNYQPILLTKSKEIYGFEVLVRWNNPDIGIIPPAVFIPIAEETGTIISLGTWIFETACRFHKNLCQKLNRDFIISINVSAQQLLDKSFVENIKRVISITNIKPQLIQIELTETVLVKLFESINNSLNELCDLGIIIALDDFGTGYSSLNYLKKFPIKCLKIDKTFVDEINSNTRDYDITDSIIGLVHSLNITTVAEGVETPEQYTLLHEMSCDLIQGFLMSKPLAQDSVENFISDYEKQ